MGRSLGVRHLSTEALSFPSKPIGSMRFLCSGLAGTDQRAPPAAPFFLFRTRVGVRQLMEKAMKMAMKGSREWALVDEKGELRCGNLHASRKELQDVHEAFSSREKAIAGGVVLGATRYEVHRHHPPLIYGREHRSDPEQSDGFALLRVQEKGTGKKLCAIVVYPMPILSAYIVPRLVEACKQHVGEVQ